MTGYCETCGEQIYSCNNIPKAPILYGTKNQIAIRCPYCKKKHFHSKEVGVRVAHCMNGLSYEIVIGDTK